MKLFIYALDGCGRDYVDCWMPNIKALLPYHGIIDEPIAHEVPGGRWSYAIWADFFMGDPDHGLSEAAGRELYKEQGKYGVWADAKAGERLWHWTQKRGYDTVAIRLLHSEREEEFGGKLISITGNLALGTKIPEGMTFFRPWEWKAAGDFPTNPPWDPDWTPQNIDMTRLIEWMHESGIWDRYAGRCVELIQSNTPLIAQMGGDVLINFEFLTDHCPHTLSWNPPLLSRVFKAVDDSFMSLCYSRQPEIGLVLSDHGMKPYFERSSGWFDPLWTRHSAPGFWASNIPFLEETETMLSIRKKLEALL